MVVQAVVVPLRNELADHDGDEIGAFGPEGVDLLEGRDAQLPIWHGDDVERHRNVLFCPRGLEGIGVIGELGEVHQRTRSAPSSRATHRASRATVERRDRDETDVVTWPAGWSSVVADRGDVHHDDPESNYLRVYVGQFRRKLEDDAANPRLILTEPGIGYRWIISEDT